MEQLIRDLNSPANQGKPQAIRDIQNQIQQLQKEPSAWQAGLDLLNKQDPLLQFYGALTLSLKIDADWDQDEIGKDRDRVSSLIEVLVSNYVRLSNDATPVLVMTKLAGALATVFAKPDAAWAYPPRHVMACAIAGRYISQTDIPTVSEMIGTAVTLKGSTWEAILRLCLAMHENVAGNRDRQVGHITSVKISNNAIDIWQVLYYTLYTYSGCVGLPQPNHQGFVMQLDTDAKASNEMFVDCVQQVAAWSILVTSTSAPAELQVLFAQSFQILLNLLSHPESPKDWITHIAAIQSENPRLLRQAVRDYQTQINNSTTVQIIVAQIMQGEHSPDSNGYVEYLQAQVEQYDCTSDEYLKESDAVAALERVQTLSKCPGPAMVEDEVCLPVLEILSTITEGYCEWGGPSPFDSSMRTLIKDATLSIFNKLRVPEQELDKNTSEWTDDDFTEFEDYRFQATSFFETAYSTFGAELLQSITESLDQNGQSSWSEFDAVLFVLTSISDALDSAPEKCDPALNQILSSKLWQDAVAESSAVSGRIRWAAIKTISQYTSFLQRNPQHMISSLNFLFHCLKRKGYASQAAKAINILCDTQRKFLVEALPQFLQTLTTLETIPSAARQKVLSGVASLIQALPTEQDRIAPLQDMLQLIQRFEQHPTVEEDNEDNEDPYHSRMAMLASMAKGLQSPADAPIDLDATSENADKSFWTHGSGSVLQQAVFNMLSSVWNGLLDAGNVALVTFACEFLRAGFKEEHPCPFKFTSNISTQLLFTMIDPQNPNLDQTMSAASCFLSSLPTSDAATFSDIDTLFNRVLELTQKCVSILLTPSNQSFSAPSSILDFIVRTFNKHGMHILSTPTSIDRMAVFFEYGILTLRTPDTLPRRSAISFFTSFLELTDPSSKYAQDSPVNVTVITLLDRYSSSILGLTLFFLGGECARSEIDSFSQLLRSFVSRQGLRAKKIMQEAMAADSRALAPKALRATKPEQRARFIAQVESLRGGKKTNEVARDFWLSCKGGQFQYVT